MRVMVIGATGTLGHRLCLDWAERFECWGTVRAPVEDPVAELLAPARLIAGISAEEPDTLRSALERARPDVVVNCVGAVKQAEAGQQPIPAIRINSLFPHELAAACRESSARMIHVSTDCVFSGERGRYSEQDVPDAADLYGRSKLLGEISGEGLLTLRTSLIGRELQSSLGLLEWLISNRGGSVKGFSRAVFSGLTTIGARVRDRRPDRGASRAGGDLAPRLGADRQARAADRARARARAGDRDRSGPQRHRRPLSRLDPTVPGDGAATTPVGPDGR